MGTIPEPFNTEEFQLYQQGISDSPSTSVYINTRKDFLFLHPAPRTDYDRYIPRVNRFNLAHYKKKLQGIRRRLEKISHLFTDDALSVLEIGAGDGTFLSALKQEYPGMHATAVDKDRNTLQMRAANSDAHYSDIDEVPITGRRFQVVCLFHVLEHVLAPGEFLAKIHRLLFHDSFLIIEVPSFSDPLLSLYGSSAYARFYFQKQHPYVYTNSSLDRLLRYNRFQTHEIINYQRYGLENHLAWLVHGRPGGSDVFQRVFETSESTYLADLERWGAVDTVIWVGKAVR